MPIYEYKCDKCEYEVDELQQIGGEAPLCSECGAEMRKKPTYPAMVKIKGMGGYPSRRKLVQGTAPYSGKAKAWLKPNPNMMSSTEPRPE